MTGTLLTTLEVAERLGLSSAAVAQAVRTGALQPTARTNEDFLFTERAVALFAQGKAEAAAMPLESPPAVSRAEWSGDLDRLNSWLKDLSESAPAAAPAPSAAAEMTPPAAPAPIATPEEARIAIDFQPPPHHVAEALAAADVPSDTDPIPDTFVAPDPVAQTPTLAAVEPAGEPAPDPVPEAVVEVPSSTDALPITVVALEPAAEEPRLTNAAEATAPLPEAVAALKSGLSRQALLVVQPIVRFRVLRDVTDRLATIRGIADARLERLESGVASYRLSFEGQRPDDETIGGALASLNLEVILVDSAL